jgi:excisionase family DNA binding protein
MQDENKIVPIDELAERLRLSRRWLNREAKAGRIPCLVAGRKRLFNIPAVEAALAKLATAHLPTGGAA